MFLASGIPVLDDTGQPIDGSPPGLAIEAMDLRLVDELGSGMGSVSLADVADSLTLADPALTGAPLPQLLAADLRDDWHTAWPETGEPPSTATTFWMWVVSNMWWAACPPTESCAVADFEAEDPADIQLNGVQLEFLLFRLANEIVLEANGTENELAVQAFAASDGSLAQVGTSLPCTYTPVEKKIVKGAEEGLSRAFKQTVSYLKDKAVTGAGRLADALKVAGIVADIAKAAAPILALQVDYKMTGSPPLVRTYKVRPQTGERRQITAHVYFDVSKSQVLNCFRLMYASMGLKFSIPQRGPHKHARVAWRGRLGFNLLERSTGRIVQFYGSDVEHAVTDDNGMTSVGVEGFGQEEAKDPNGPTEIKQAAVQLVVSIKNSDLGEDLFDVAKTAESFWKGAAIAAPVHVALEMILRWKIISKGIFYFDVKDFERTCAC